LEAVLRATRQQCELIEQRSHNAVDDDDAQPLSVTD
jgi:hypothetical protein